MQFQIEPSSPVPMYQQLEDQIRLAVASGRLEPGERLPGSRSLAEELQINLHTINKAYQELVREGVLEQKRGIGTFVSENPTIRSNKEALNKIEEKLSELCEEARAYGIKKETLQQLINNHWSNTEQDSDEEES